jgi:hypothetical protein
MISLSKSDRCPDFAKQASKCAFINIHFSAWLGTPPGLPDGMFA